MSVKTYIAYSGGVESTTMALMFGHKAQCVFTDTGAEHPEMYARLDSVEKTLKKIHGDNFQIIRIKAKNADSTGTDNLTDYILHYGYFPSPQARFCTRAFKIEPMNNFLKTAGDCVLMIGLNADEVDKRDGNLGTIPSIKISYPLVDLGITRKMCVAALKEYELEPKLPVYMRRGGCVYCPFKSKKEYIAMAHLAPSQLESVAALEEKVHTRARNQNKKFYGVRDGIPSMRGLIEDEKRSLFSASEMYDQQPDDIGTPCGVFCHR